MVLCDTLMIGTKKHPLGVLFIIHQKLYTLVPRGSLHNTLRIERWGWCAPAQQTTLERKLRGAMGQFRDNRWIA